MGKGRNATFLQGKTSSVASWVTATRTLRYGHNDKGILLFSKQSDRLGAQRASCSEGTGGTEDVSYCSTFASICCRRQEGLQNASTPPYAVMARPQQYWRLGKMQSSINQSAVGCANHRKCCDTNTRKQPLCESNQIPIRNKLQDILQCNTYSHLAKSDAVWRTFTRT
jgi:hypothetical protein